MTKNTRLSTLVVNAQADALAALAAGGFLDMYDGVQPKSADDPVTTQKLGVSQAAHSCRGGRAFPRQRPARQWPLRSADWLWSRGR